MGPPIPIHRAALRNMDQFYGQVLTVDEIMARTGPS